MIITLDPRDLDRHHSNEVHRPDLPTYGASPWLGDLQVDTQWSYAEQPGGWVVPPLPIPEPSTWLLMAIGVSALLAIRTFRRFALAH